MIIDFKPGVRQMPTRDMMEAVARTEEEMDTRCGRKLKPEKKDKTPTYNFTLEQINAMLDKAREQAVKEAVGALIELMLGLPIMILHDKHGWGKTRNSRLVDDVMNLYDSYEKGYLTLEDVREVLWEEAETRIQRADKAVTWKGDKK